MSDGLRAFTDALRERRDGTIGSVTPRPNFADVLARAARARAERGEGEGDPVAVSTSAFEGPGDEAEHHDPDLEAFTAALHDRYARVLARRARALPSAPSRRSKVALHAGLALAAALLLTVGVVALLSSSRLHRSEEGIDAMGALRERDTSPGREGIALPRTPSATARPRSSGGTAPLDEAPSPVDLLPPLPPSVDAPTVPPEAVPVEAPRPARKRNRNPEATSSNAPPHDPVAALEAAAREAWAQGRLAAAERHFREILRREGKSRRADLAYGDLFSLAAQRSGRAGQAAVWREYLEAFPRGTFAEDARAGLCRRGAPEARAACWSAYLVEHPHGSHAAEARRDLDEAAR